VMGLHSALFVLLLAAGPAVLSTGLRAMHGCVWYNLKPAAHTLSQHLQAAWRAYRQRKALQEAQQREAQERAWERQVQRHSHHWQREPASPPHFQVPALEVPAAAGSSRGSPLAVSSMHSPRSRRLAGPSSVRWARPDSPLGSAHGQQDCHGQQLQQQQPEWHSNLSQVTSLASDKFCSG
jgi:hypothetical protein